MDGRDRVIGDQGMRRTVQWKGYGLRSGPDDLSTRV